MNKEEIKEFLKHKTGYLKEGGYRLKKILNNKGFVTTVSDCKQAIRETNRELKIKPYIQEEGDEPKILFYDIEVSYGLAKVWRPTYNGVVRYDDFITKPKIICISWKWSFEDEVHSVQWDSKQNDKSLLEQFIPELNKADFICGHNSDKFDLPWIRTRALYHRLEILPKYVSVDTLKIARYKYNFPSNKLDDIGEYLGLGRKIKVDMSLWDRVILNKDSEALDEMINYCNVDVLLLEKIYNKLTEQELPVIHVGVLEGKTKQTSPFTGGINLELIKTTTTKAGVIKRLMKCLDTNKYFEMSNSNYKKYLITK